MSKNDSRLLEIYVALFSAMVSNRYEANEAHQNALRFIKELKKAL